MFLFDEMKIKILNIDVSWVHNYWILEIKVIYFKMEKCNQK